MVKVLIVSKTHMNCGVCVGGIIEDTGELIRIHNERGGNLSEDAPYELGDEWDMMVENAWNPRPLPHVEDKQIKMSKYIKNIGIYGIVSYVKEHNLGTRLVRGSITETFEGCLHFDRYKNYINDQNVPNFSTQFWVADEDLRHVVSFSKNYYVYKNYRLKFVGLQEPVEKIPAGTLIRLSLANWWDGDGSGEKRCYLQLSGWYL